MAVSLERTQFLASVRVRKACLSGLAPFLLTIEFRQVNCESDKQALLILRNFSATKIKVDRKRGCLGLRKFGCKCVLADSGHLRKKMRKMGLLVRLLHDDS